MAYMYIDPQETTWIIHPVPPKGATAMHEGERAYGWEVKLIAPDGKGSVVHQHHNLSEAVAQAVAKADWL